MLKINKIFSRKSNNKLSLLILGLFLLVLVLIFWLSAWQNVGNQVADNLNIQVDSQQKINDKIKAVIEKNSCDLKNESLVKGYIEKIDGFDMVINNGLKQTRLTVKPEAVIVRVSVYPNGNSEITELPRSEIKVGQDVVLSVFTDENGNNYSLLVKQIELKNI